MRSRKRERSPSTDDAAVTARAPAVEWPPASVLYHHVGRHLGDASFWDHWHFAQTNRALWYYYREHDPCMRAMMHYVFDPYARQHETSETRRDHVRDTGILRCLQWAWEKESPWAVKEGLADEYIQSAADKGSLEGVRHFAPYITDAEAQNNTFLAVVRSLVRLGHDKEACQLVNDTMHWLPNWRLDGPHYISLYIAAATFAHQVPNFFTTIHSRCLEANDSKTAQEAEDLRFSLFCTAIFASIGADGELNEASFLYFWRKAPTDWLPRATYDLFFQAGTALLHDGQHSRSTWATILSRLPYVASRYIQTPVMEVLPPKSSEKGVRWTFAARGPERPAITLECHAFQVNTKTKEVDCRVTYVETGPVRLAFNLIFTMPIACTPFYLRPAVGEDAGDPMGELLVIPPPLAVFLEK